jgi:hypothetical protein
MILKLGFTGCLFMAFVFMFAVASESDAATVQQPHLSRVSPNQLSNPSFIGTANWALSGGAQYDPALSRSADGSGSIRLPMGGRVDSGVVAVTPGKTYIFAAYIRTSAWPPGMVDMVFVIVNANGSYSGYGGETGASGNSGPNKWEEIALTITPDANTHYISLGIGRIYPDSGVSDIWVDEMYFGEGTGFGSPPTTKKPFNGADVQVDELGNFSVKKKGVFQPFFPFCIYGDARRPNAYQTYSNQGFNCDMWGYSGTLQQAKKAVSAFNPDGMMVGIGVAQFMNQGGWGYDSNGVNLTNEIKAMKATGLMDSHVLLYYWDNENVWDQWNNQMRRSSIITSNDVSPSGQRLHPFYVLQGSYNAARMYHDTQGVSCCDVTGTYADSANTGGAGHAGGQEIIQNIEGQDQPVTFEQMNIVSKYSDVGTLRGYLYRHVARGARGIGLWRDCFSSDCSGYADPVDQAGWWPDVPNLRRELDQMLPLIRQPHWTTWKVAYNDALPITVGARDYQGEGYLIVANNFGAPTTTVTFTLTGLGYTPQRVVDFFSGNTVGSLSGHTFTVTLPALGLKSGTAVYRIVSN